MKKKCKKAAAPTEHAVPAVKPKKKKNRSAPIDEATAKERRKRAAPDDGGAKGPATAEVETPVASTVKKKKKKHLQEPEPAIKPAGKKQRDLGNIVREEPAVAEAEATAGGANGTNSDEGGAAQGHAKYSCFVGGIPFACDEEEVRKDFAECGEVVGFRFPRDGQGYPKGFCFVDYATREGLDAALAYDGDDYGGRQLQVKETAARKTSTGGGKGGPINPGEKPAGCKSVILKNLAYGVTDFDLRRHFQAAGNIVNVTLLKHRKTQEPNGIAFVDFGTTEQVDVAIGMNDTALKGRKMHVSYSRTKRK